MPNLYSPPLVQPNAEAKKLPQEFATPEHKTGPPTPLSPHTVTQPSWPLPAPNPLQPIDDFHSCWSVHACHLDLAPLHEKKLRLPACLSPKVAEELQGYISCMASF